MVELKGTSEHQQFGFKPRVCIFCWDVSLKQRRKVRGGHNRHEDISSGDRESLSNLKAMGVETKSGRQTDKQRRRLLES